MRVDVAGQTIEFAAPVLTPVGPMTSVAAVEVTVTHGGVRATGRVRCSSTRQADGTVAAVHELVERSGLARGVPDDLWPWWSAAWSRLEAVAIPGQRRALAAIDAAIWDLAGPDLARASAPDVRIYWSGFWLGCSTDAARREAARATAAGYDAVKMRVDVADIASSVARFSAIAAELPAAMGIAVEFAGSGSPRAVEEFVGGIDTARVLWVEDPLPVAVAADTARVAAGLGVPVGGGEHCSGVRAFTDYLDAAGIAFPIIDFGQCGGPSALLAALGGPVARFPAIGIHLDATLAATTLARVAVAPRVYVEVLDWWEQTTPDELRVRLRG